MNKLTLALLFGLIISVYFQLNLSLLKNTISFYASCKNPTYYEIWSLI